MSTDLVVFVRARLDEHAETARLAIGVNGAAAVRLHQQGSAAAVNYPLPVWSYDAGQVWQHDKYTPTVVVGKTWGADGAHIALNDPVHVLAWVAAVRVILKQFEDVSGVPAWAEYERGQRAALQGALRALAGIWRTHPDYDPRWTPEAADAPPAKPEPEPPLAYVWTDPRTGKQLALAPEDVTVVRSHVPPPETGDEPR